MRDEKFCQLFYIFALKVTKIELPTKNFIFEHSFQFSLADAQMLHIPAVNEAELTRKF